VKEIFPSAAAGTPPAARRPAPVAPPAVAPAPTWVSNPGYWEYALVPDDFVPPLRADQPRLVFVRLVRSKPGLVSYIVLDRLGFSHLGKPPGFNDWGDFSTGRAQDFKLLNEDFQAILDETRSPSWKGSPAVNGFVHTVITCGYQESRVYHFWYKVRPAPADPVRLRGRMLDHPILQVGRPVDMCPLSETDARDDVSGPTAKAPSATVAREFKPTAWWSSLIGTWTGSTQGANPERTITLELHSSPGGLGARLQSSDGLAGETRVRLVDGTREVAAQSTSQIVVEGRLSSDQKTIEGQLTVWFWTPKTMRLVLTKRD
jgi:hypothetical protein